MHFSLWPASLARYMHAYLVASSEPIARYVHAPPLTNRQRYAVCSSRHVCVVVACKAAFGLFYCCVVHHAMHAGLGVWWEWADVWGVVNICKMGKGRRYAVQGQCVCVCVSWLPAERHSLSCNVVWRIIPPRAMVTCSCFWYHSCITMP